MDLKFKKVYILLTLLICFTDKSLATQNENVVKIEEGLVRGTTLNSSRSNKTIIAFMGIPYGKPPVGELRFEAPKPAEHWDGIKRTTIEGAVCPQYDIINNTYMGEEDCLFINVFTSEIPNQENNTNINKPVMVWINGNSYIAGSGNRDFYGPDFLVDEDIVFVSFNYRLGLLGFLSFQNNKVPGNNGLKDQILALKWVKNNIDKFGGDPNKVTVFGESSGASCIHFHLLSPLSNGLFQQAISQSGTSLNPWAYQTPESSINLAERLGKIFGANSTDFDDILNVLKQVNAKDLVDYMHKKVFKIQAAAIIGPTLDTNATDGEVFLPDIPINLIKQGKFNKIPYLLGYNTEEALIMTEGLKKLSWALKNVTKVLEFYLPYFTGQSIPDVGKMAAEVEKKYFENNNTLEFNYVNLISDLLFINGVNCTAYNQASISNTSVFVYEFSFNGTANIFKKFFNVTETPGACHGDELPYLLHNDVLNVTFREGSNEYLTSSRIVKMWSNFAKTGNPTPYPDPLLQNITWSPVSNLDFPYLSIDINLKLKYNLNNGNPIWWNQLFRTYTPNASTCWPMH